LPKLVGPESKGPQPPPNWANKLNFMINHFRDWVFKNVHGGSLVYNICWEDPRCDRELMQIEPDSEIVMITSAGCNALDYLLDAPKAIHCIDLNSRQNALLEFKKSLFKHSSYDELYDYFGDGKHAQAEEVYRQQLRPHLPAYAQEFWDQKMSYFEGKGPKKSFYYRGSSGTLAWLFVRYMQMRPSLHSKVLKLLKAETLEAQEQYVEQVERKLFNKAVRWTISRHFSLALAGVPRAQRRLITEEYPGGVSSFVVDAVRHVFTELDIKENYFWQVYVNGHYTKDCCPSYLREENYLSLRERADNIHTHTTSFSQFLKENPGQYSHYVLLDHQDWLAAHDVPALEEEWQYILANSRPGTKILMRSAAMRIDFFPDFVKERVSWVSSEEELKESHFQDRVGTYGSVYLGTVK